MIQLYYYKAQVHRVIDGDTIVLDVDLGFNQRVMNEHFRLFGINAPETRTKDLDEKTMGQRARERLEELCPAGTELLIRTEKSKDKYGRYLVHLYLNDVDEPSINDMLVSEGFAEVYLV